MKGVTTVAEPPRVFNIVNPIWTKGWRSRLRLKHLLSWGLITLTITTFVCTAIYLPAVRRGLADEKSAAQGVLLAVLIIQAAILMLLGTGAVASGLANERDQGLLDYQRMTPMSPRNKIIGYLIGLPAREYALVGLTIPFLLFAVIVGEVSIPVLVHYYLVFFSSVLLYHMTGMVAGMLSPKPRRAAMLAQAGVIVLYLVLPGLSAVGLTFFEHLTIRPTIYRLLQDELTVTNLRGGELGNPFGAGDNVPFFNWTLHPSLFTLLLQGSLLWLMYTVVHRKWADEGAHGVTKVRGLAAIVVTAVLALGCIWPIIMNVNLTGDMFVGLMNIDDPRALAGALVGMSFSVVLIVGMITLTVLHAITPSRYMMLKGLRRSAKLGQDGVPFNADGASSVWVTVIAANVVAGLAAALVVLQERSGRVFGEWPPVVEMVKPLVLVVAIVFFYQGVRQRFGGLASMVILFMVWMVPVFVGVIMMAAWEQYELACYVALPMPPVALGFAGVRMYMEAGGSLFPPPIPPDVPFADHIPVLSWCATVGYAAAAVGVQVMAWKWRRGLRREWRESRAVMGGLVR